MHTSPLTPQHEALKAEFMDLDGARVVARYGDPADEHRAVRAAGGLIDRCYRGLLEVSGPDRVALLQSMTTNDVDQQAVDRAIEDAICTNHGKVQSLFSAIKLEDRFLLDMDPVLSGFTHSFLDKYTIIREAKTVDLSEQWGHLGLYGPGSRTVLVEALGGGAAGLPGEPGAVAHLRDGTLLVVGSRESGEDGFELLTPAGEVPGLWTELVRAGAPRGVAPFGFLALESLRMEGGRPRYGVEVDDSHILLEAGLLEAVSFEKGCYIGQETLSRVVFRGHLNRKLCGLVVDGAAPAAGAEVSADGKAVGEVKSATVSPSLGRVIALAYLRSSHWEAGAKVEVAGTPAEVADLPFYRPAT